VDKGIICKVPNRELLRVRTYTSSLGNELLGISLHLDFCLRIQLDERIQGMNALLKLHRQPNERQS
jgi:uncharacterized protein YlaN (UPF0358 family)